MSTAAGRSPVNWRERLGARGAQQVRNELAHIEPAAKSAGQFWTKVNNDWVFNLSGLLAYNLLMSIFPILLVLLAVAGLILGQLSPSSTAHLHASIGAVLPGGSQVIQAVTQQLARSAGVLLLIGIVTAIFTGSRLFITMESCFGVIFRLRTRDPLRQNLMALGMLLLFAVLAPFVSLGSVIPSALVRALSWQGHQVWQAFITQMIGILASVAVAALLFAAIYVVVPNRPVRLGEIWRGTLVAAVLLTLYELLFPLYETHVLRPGNYGAVAGYAIVILVFFYYLGFILLLGAEVNSWAAGQRQTAGDIPTMLHEMEAQATRRGAAGSTVGEPRADVQRGEGAAAMGATEAARRHERDQRRSDAQPPKGALVQEPGAAAEA